MVTAGTPAALTKAVTELLEVVTEIFLDFGLSLNWKRGKSEMMLQFIGKRAVRQMERLRQLDGTLAFPLPERCAGNVLHIVDSYKHLGGFVSSDGTGLLDARYRADTARTASVSLCVVCLLGLGDSHCGETVFSELARDEQVAIQRPHVGREAGRAGGPECRVRPCSSPHSRVDEV